MLHFTAIFVLFFVKLGFLGSSVGKECTGNAGDPSLISGSGKSTGEWILLTPVFLGFPGGSAGEEPACNVEDLGFISGLGRLSGEGNSYLLLHSVLENAMD